MTDKTMVVHCGTPMIWTFFFEGTEFYCRKCGAKVGMFGGNTIKATPKLIKESEENKKWFRNIMKDYIPLGAYMKDCDQCTPPREPHINHASAKEIEKSKKALENLQREIAI